MTATSHGPLRYDTHTHSHISDGTDAPAAIAREVSRLGLGGFALTDHDTAAGWDEARRAAAKCSIDFLPGMELTTKHGSRSTHLLVYGADPTHPDLVAELSCIHASREQRAQHMVDRLGEDFAITWDDVCTDTTQAVGRPHIADALVRLGYVRDRGEAFATLLGPGSPYYVPTYAPDTRDAIGLARRAGGVPVLAHPAAVRHRTSISAAGLHELAEAGLWGIELDHPENDPARLPELARATAECRLLALGASDYHGAGKANRLGECTTPKSTVDLLREGMRIKR